VTLAGIILTELAPLPQRIAQGFSLAKSKALQNSEKQNAVRVFARENAFGLLFSLALIAAAIALIYWAGH
jgi:hypothetical protein